MYVTVGLSRPEPESSTEPPDGDHAGAPGAAGVGEEMVYSGGRRVPWSGLARAALAALVVPACAAGLAVAVPGSLGAGPLARTGAGDAAAPCGATWVTAWQAAPQAAPTADGLTGATLRVIVHPQVGGAPARGGGAAAGPAVQRLRVHAAAGRSRIGGRVGRRRRAGSRHRAPGDLRRPADRLRAGRCGAGQRPGADGGQRRRPAGDQRLHDRRPGPADPAR